MKTTLRPCPICLRTEAEVLHAESLVLPDGHLLPASFEIACCACCGAVFNDTAATQTDYDRFYQTDSIYEDGHVSSGSGAAPHDRKRLSDAARRIVEKTGFNARVLDIGCANGGLLRELKTLGVHNLWGLDPSPACVGETVRGGDIHASVGSLFALPEFTEPFDVVVLSQVLEHVCDLRGSLAAIGRLIGPNGLVYVEVPDASRYASFVSAPFQDFNIEHINHFSIHSLANLFSFFSLRPAGSGSTDIESAPGVPYPAIYAFFSNNRSDTAHVFSRDIDLRPRILEYIRRSNTILDRIRAKVDAAIASCPRVIVWGTGQFAFKLLAQTSLGKASIAAFVDSNQRMQGKTLCGAPVIAPESLRRLPSDLPVIIASLIHHRQITGQMAALGVANKAVTLD